mmetsp:Transcript_98526/g.279201  ORF Transcript_98526/g.279201 Transcript_98526/m.279201 type:complete len:263 (-) Transcript_98526:498-1286(-)
MMLPFRPATFQSCQEDARTCQSTSSLESLPPGSRFGTAHRFQFSSEISSVPSGSLPLRRATTASFIMSSPVLARAASPASPDVPNSSSKVGSNFVFFENPSLSKIRNLSVSWTVFIPARLPSRCSFQKSRRTHPTTRCPRVYPNLVPGSKKSVSFWMSALESRIANGSPLVWVRRCFIFRSAFTRELWTLKCRNCSQPLNSWTYFSGWKSLGLSSMVTIAAKAVNSLDADASGKDAVASALPPSALWTSPLATSSPAAVPNA